MKKMILNFGASLLSREQMKKVKGGNEDESLPGGECGANACTATSDCPIMGCDNKTCTDGKCQ